MQALPRLVADPAALLKGWPTAPQVHHGAASWARSLLSRDDIGTLLARTDLASSRVRMSKDNALLDPAAYADGVDAQLEAGASLLVTGLDHDWEPIRAFCRAATAELGHPVRANSYLTPPGSQGFTHHWDDHASFLVQTHGAKTWELYPPLVEYPARPHSFTPEELAARRADGTVPDPPYLTVELRAGDVLWLPHGWIHNGFTTGEWSLHVTLGLGAITRADLITPLLRALAGDVRARTPLPPNPAPDEDAVRAEALRTRRLLVEMARELDDATLVAAVRPMLGGSNCGEDFSGL